MKESPELRKRPYACFPRVSRAEPQPPKRLIQCDGIANLVRSRLWTPDEMELLRRRFIDDDAIYAVIAMELGRPVDEVRKKGQRMGLWRELLVTKAQKSLNELVLCSACGTFNSQESDKCGSCGVSLRRTSERDQPFSG